MPMIVSELFEALLSAGVAETLAREAAAAVVGSGADLATKADVFALKADLAELRLATKADLAKLESDLIKWNVGTLVALTAIFAAIVRFGVAP